MNRPALVVCLIAFVLTLGSASAQVKPGKTPVTLNQPVTVTLVRWPYT